ncbi:protoporphyrinogen oxidase-like protein [Amylocarpus encephaloides]|uniref:Protoporphyrinogen oxidase n=1 Tax=Amylocarpus encephaloides TaxID=45428 RepID=A0A9P7YTI3_9HELO|nr:protoporphyrinogen oxidase-like protein [Amylocarpus encephaloides]
MRSQLSEHVVVALLKPYYTIPGCQSSQSSSRSFHSTRTPPTCRSGMTPRAHRHQQRFNWTARNQTIASAERSIGEPVNSQAYTSNVAAQRSRGWSISQSAEEDYAILGGGITGLSAAHFLTKEKPTATITIYEGSKRLGGWLQSQRIEVDGGTILFEQGPRTLRPNLEGSGITILELIHDLKLTDEVLVTPKDSEAAKNRMVYYPDHLVTMPGPGQGFFEILWKLITEPALKWVLPGMYNEWFNKPRPKHLEDESIGDFLERKLGSTDAADNTVSAILHGIYAGDVYQLSAKSLLSSAWRTDGSRGSIQRGTVDLFAKGVRIISARDQSLIEKILPGLDRSFMEHLARYASVYSFKDGISTLVTALEKSLRANPRVQFKTSHRVKTLKYDQKEGLVKISTKADHQESFTKVISTLSGPNLSSITATHENPDPLPSLNSIHSVTVMVVNLYFPDPDVLPVHGFGYLIPRAIPFDQNPECALGVVFDSDAVSQQDAVLGTKVTVMIGGHWWDDFSEYPSQDEGVAMARAILERHLKITAVPTATNVGLHENCIPQYTVGHDARMKKAHFELMKAFNGKVAVAGNSYNGVGLADCVASARDVVTNPDGNLESALTGLNGFLSERKYEILDLKEARKDMRRHVELSHKSRGGKKKDR